MRGLVQGVGRVLLAVGLSGCPSGAAPQKQNLTRWCGPPLSTQGHLPVSLSGHLVKKTVWGPPNFGETPNEDKRYTVWMLELDYVTPMIADVDEGGPGRTVVLSLVQLLGAEASPNRYDDFLNRHVLVTGELWTGDTPLANTPVTLNPTAVKITGDLQCDGRPAIRL
jgi:hypothetical protein